MKLSKIAEILNIELSGADAEITAINSLQNANEFSDPLRAGAPSSLSALRLFRRNFTAAAPFRQNFTSAYLSG